MATEILLAEVMEQSLDIAGAKLTVVSAKASLVVGLVAFVSGGAIMVYEFLAVRILQRYFGGSVDVWASEIAVCLAGLAIGYTLGGRIADRYRSLFITGIAISIGGLLGFSIEKLAEFADFVLVQVDVGLAWHPLIAAGFSTFLPILALGTILPQAIRIQARKLDTIGSVVGWIATISTVGSIAGVLIVAMGLLPRWGVIEILYGLSGFLVVFGFVIAFGSKRLTAVAALLLLSLPNPASAQVLFETYSAYHHILVRDVNSTRILLFDDARQSLMSRTDPYAGGFEYADFFHMPVLFDPTIRRVLFIGLGGATGPKSYFKHYPNMQIEVVELDPQVLRAAKTYFALPQNPRLKVHISDGRAFLRRARGTYGAIMMDAYATGQDNQMYLPYHMATQEFLRIVWDKLDNGGCLFYNAVGIVGGRLDYVIRHLQVTLESVFQAVYVFQARSSENTIFIAVKIDPTKLDENGNRDGKPWPQGPWFNHLLNTRQLQSLVSQMPAAFRTAVPNMSTRVAQFSRAQGAKRTGTILTDNYAPVDLPRIRQ